MAGTYDGTAKEAHWGNYYPPGYLQPTGVRDYGTYAPNSYAAPTTVQQYGIIPYGDRMDNSMRSPGPVLMSTSGGPQYASHRLQQIQGVNQARADIWTSYQNARSSLDHPSALGLAAPRSPVNHSQEQTEQQSPQAMRRTPMPGFHANSAVNAQGPPSWYSPSQASNGVHSYMPHPSFCRAPSAVVHQSPTLHMQGQPMSRNSTRSTDMTPRTQYSPMSPQPDAYVGQSTLPAMTAYPASQHQFYFGHQANGVHVQAPFRQTWSSPEIHDPQLCMMARPWTSHAQPQTVQNHAADPISVHVAHNRPIEQSHSGTHGQQNNAVGGDSHLHVDKSQQKYNELIQHAKVLEGKARKVNNSTLWPPLHSFEDADFCCSVIGTLIHPRKQQQYIIKIKECRYFIEAMERKMADPGCIGRARTAMRSNATLLKDQHDYYTKAFRLYASYIKFCRGTRGQNAMRSNASLPSVAVQDTSNSTTPTSQSNRDGSNAGSSLEQTVKDFVAGVFRNRERQRSDNVATANTSRDTVPVNTSNSHDGAAVPHVSPTKNHPTPALSSNACSLTTNKESPKRTTVSHSDNHATQACLSAPIEENELITGEDLSIERHSLQAAPMSGEAMALSPGQDKSKKRPLTPGGTLDASVIDHVASGNSSNHKKPRLDDGSHLELNLWNALVASLREDDVAIAAPSASRGSEASRSTDNQEEPDHTNRSAAENLNQGISAEQVDNTIVVGAAPVQEKSDAAHIQKRGAGTTDAPTRNPQALQSCRKESEEWCPLRALFYSRRGAGYVERRSRRPCMVRLRTPSPAHCNGKSCGKRQRSSIFQHPPSMTQLSPTGPTQTQDECLEESIWERYTDYEAYAKARNFPVSISNP